MSLNHPGFFDRAQPVSLTVLADVIGAEVGSDRGADLSARMISDVAALNEATLETVCFFSNPKYKDELLSAEPGACLVKPAHVDLVPETSVPLTARDPYAAFARAIAHFYPTAIASAVHGGAADARVDVSAEIEDGAIIEPGAVVGAEAQIGRGARIASGAVVGHRCTIGRDSYIGPNASVICALIGDRVIIHGGVRVGQDGFGFAMSAAGHLKVPQIGRVIIQDDVEIGANTTIDRGALSDTVIGEGTKIDNLVQIAHNVVIGRHCIIVAHVGISGSTQLGDFVVMGGQSGTVGHISVGTGAQIAGASHVKDNIPAGARVGGTPAKPLREWARELAAIKRLGRGGSS